MLNPRLLKFFDLDTDHLFSYNTKVEVVYGIKILGVLHNLCIFALWVYVVGVSLIWDQGFLAQEPSPGFTNTFVSGNVLATSSSQNKRLFDASEIVGPTNELGTVFVATKATVSQETRGTCEDYNLPCDSPLDCAPGVGALCSPDHFCVEPSWCPEENLIHPTESAKPEVFKLNSDKIRIWVKSSVRFQELYPDHVFHGDLDNPILYPHHGYNTFSVRDLLMLSDPPVRFEEISELGAALEVTFTWKCQVELSTPCAPMLHAHRLDTIFDQDNIGFQVKQVYNTSPNEREVHLMQGVRFYFHTVGTLRKFSPHETILRISTGLALMGIVPVIVDLLMLRCFKGRYKYAARKYEHSPHFNSKRSADMLERDELLEQQEQEEKTGKTGWGSAFSLMDTEDRMSPAEELLEEQDAAWHARWLADEGPPEGVPVRTPIDYLKD